MKTFRRSARLPEPGAAGRTRLRTALVIGGLLAAPLVTGPTVGAVEPPTVPAPEAPVALPPADAFARADLVASLRAGTASEVVRNGTRLLVVPVQVTVRNAGAGNATLPTNVSAYRLSANGASYLHSLVLVSGAGSQDGWSVTVPPLAAGASTTFRGRIEVPTSLLDNLAWTVWQVEADSCAGEEFTPASCTIAESDETNNLSTPVLVVRP
ncbi:MAG: hypothetical protein OEY23_18325 [Acidimicrobiia bacterium]|nr:hypothetical protein [Acidimicrobiia bacterium]